MKRRILWIGFLALVLSFSLVSFTPTIHAATQKTQIAACGPYPIKGSAVNGKDVSGNTVTLTLWYNSCTGYNYGVVNFYYYYRGQICINVRSSIGGGGSCGPIVSGTGTFTGPAVYAPTSQAQATFSAAYPNSDMYIQTGWY